ncbi:MAG: hypothetical protein IJ866_04010 [Alphaproteobacteria bacterium]|nr:hypothetical protein [Alphaproteobacteria bacterium]
MHFFKKTIGLMAVLCVIPGAFAATARPSVITTAGSRMPTMVVKTSTAATSSGTTTSSALLADAECIDAYTECIKGADACGENFEECTTNVLFHGKMPGCLSTLAQCSSAGVNSLFGTSNIAALSNVATKNTYGEVTEYTYPTAGSVLGQMITAAAISNQYDTSTCVRRVTSCLKKDTVCGNDFELCTTNKEFRKQRVLCDSTLARCQAEGVIELLGSSNRTAVPTATSRIGEMISEGAALAAVNAVSTCYKVIDQCFLGACAENPYKCFENSSTSLASIVDAINSGSEITTDMIDTVINGSSIHGYIKNACLDTVGSNKYCYATFLGNGQMPTNAQLRDEDNQEEIFDEAYASRMNAGMKAKIADLIDKFDTRAKSKCTETIKSCAMRVCGGGIGSACYAAVFGGADKSINGSNTYEEIKTGCAPIVNTDTYCKYAAANPNSTGTYSYTYINRDAFDVLFPEYSGGTEIDSIGVVASLNSALATNYSDAAIAQLKKQCQSLATSCVKTMCGTDYTSCYRNRTDVASSLTNSGNSAFDASMNKVGGVLDYTIVLGLCLDTVKNASVCEEHLAIEGNKIKMAGAGTSSWGGASSVREGWIDAGAATKVTGEVRQVALTDAYGNELCRTQDGEECICNTVSESGKVCDIKEMIDYTTFVQTQAANSLFKDLIYDIEKEAQAKYNAKLTAEQNMCLAANAGGIVGNRDNGSTFMWVKLKGNRIPKDYTTNGLKQTAFATSNELYGSFCRVRVTLQSDDKKIQEAISGKSWNTAYYAVGDSFTCGSWIPESALDDLANAAADDATSNMRADQERVRTWTTILGALGGGAGGLALGENIRTGKTLGGLTGLSPDVQKNKAKSSKTSCIRAANEVAYPTATAQNVYDYSGTVASDARDLKAALDSELTLLNGQRTVLLTAINTTCADGDKTCLSNKENAIAKAKSDVQTTVASIKAGCDKATEDDVVASKDKTRGWISALSTITLGTAGALLVNRATQDIQDSELSAAQKAAYEDWMNKVGRHITCYIGGDEAGNYGDVITTALE